MPLGFYNYKEVMKSSKDFAFDEIMLGRNEEIKGVKKFLLCERKICVYV